MACMNVRPALEAIREVAAATGEQAPTHASLDRDLWAYIVRLQDAVLAADRPWPFPAPGVFDDPKRLVAEAAADIRELESHWAANAGEGA